MSWQNEQRVCLHCGAGFYPNAHNQKYCSEAHKQAAENKRWYERHKQERIRQILIQRAIKEMPGEVDVKEVGRIIGVGSVSILAHIHGQRTPQLAAHKRTANGLTKWWVARDDLIAWLKAKGRLGAVVKRKSWRNRKRRKRWN